MEKNDREVETRRETERIDDWLRRGLDADRATIARLVRGALNAGPVEPRRRPATRTAALAAAIALVAIVAALYSGYRNRAPSAVQAARVEIPTITNESGTVEVLYPRARVAPGTPGLSELPRSNDNILIFNSDGLIIAIAPAPMTRHFILGGNR
jgi:hypothetical protein